MKKSKKINEMTLEPSENISEDDLYQRETFAQSQETYFFSQFLQGTNSTYAITIKQKSIKKVGSVF